MNSKIEYYENRLEASTSQLTIIITLRTVDHYDMVERLEYRKLNNNSLREKLEFLVVDHGSKDHEIVRRKCEKLGFNYIYIQSGDEDFNAGLARNIGAMHAKSDYICHEDIDLISCDENYYQDLLIEIEVNDLKKDNKKFLSVPVMYLTESGTQEFFNTPEYIRKSLFIQYLLDNNKEKFSFYMPASSVIIVNRYHYLSMGGYNEEFKGWGLEDLEYAFRLTREANQFHTPMDYKQLISKPEFALQHDYLGWRVQFRLHGDLLGRKGAMLFHVHHPIDRTWRNGSKHKDNHDLFSKSIERFSSKGQYLSPLPFKSVRTLTFGKGCFVYNPVMRPLWGDLDVKGYEYFDDKNIVEYIKENSIDLVVFTNPYANSKRLSVYNIIKFHGIPYYVVERGALDNSIFIDKTGFCCESTMYREEYWNKELSETNYKKTLEYIQTEKNNSNALERQGDRKSAKVIREELLIPKFKKILFVPLQSRSDTTVNHFAGDIGSFDNFINLLNKLSSIIPNDWEIIVKKHPLSKIEEEIKGVKFVDKYHIKDLISLCDYVLLMNSGVGVLSTLWNKPVIYTAQAFYESSKLNRKAASAEEVVEIIQSGFKPDIENSIKFISYLINEFYSFGVMKTRLAGYTDKSNLTITDAIDIYELNLEGKNLYHKDILSKKTDYKSILYSPFRKSIEEDVLRKKTIVRPRPSQPLNEKAITKKVEAPTVLKSNANISKQEMRVRKFNKLKHSPRAFFRDMLKNMKKEK